MPGMSLTSLYVRYLRHVHSPLPSTPVRFISFLLHVYKGCWLYIGPVKRAAVLDHNNVQLYCDQRSLCSGCLATHYKPTNMPEDYIFDNYDYNYNYDEISEPIPPPADKRRKFDKATRGPAILRPPNDQRVEAT